MNLILKLWLPLVALFAFSQCTAQIPNAKTETVKVYGNCGMCEKTIEKAAFQPGEAQAEWDQNTQLATITFDSSKTSANAVLQRIAAAGYDSDQFKAPENAYAGLAECCRYERPKTAEAAVTPTVPPSPTPPAGTMIKKHAVAVSAAKSPLSAVYTAYFALKDALVLTDAAVAAKEAQVLTNAISAVSVADLDANQQAVWTKHQQKLGKAATAIHNFTDTDSQREHFATLSKNMYAVIKAIPPGTTVYYDHCPMYGDGENGNWLSTDLAIKNPYFGDKMLNCGRVKETLR